MSLLNIYLASKQKISSSISIRYKFKTRLIYISAATDFRAKRYIILKNIVYTQNIGKVVK